MTSTLSSRGADANISGKDEAETWAVISNLWNPSSNPDGFISLGVAENPLMHDKLHSFLSSKNLLGSNAVALTYGDGPSGARTLLQALSAFFNRYWHAIKPVASEQIMATNGITAAIEHCAWALTNPGEGILLGRPYYRSFLSDISLRTGTKVVPVSFGGIDPISSGCIQKYEEALIASNEKGVKIRALMLCNPHNPLGRCHSRDTIIGIMKLCQKYKIHLISDEIYSLSVWSNTVDKLDTPPASFESVLSIDLNGIIDSDLVHVLWGTSKDFGANGIRIGFILSQANPEFLTACRACALYSSPSSLAENALKEVITDASFLESYITENQKRLSAAYTHAVQLLQKHGIGHKPGVNAAFFLWVNLGKKYLENHPDALSEKEKSSLTDLIYEKLMEKKVYVVHGGAAGSEEPGWYRVVFSQSREVIEEGISRIYEAIN